MLVDRKRYVDRIMLFQDTDLVKVVTGIRRCGKSSLLELVQQRLIAHGVAPSQVISVNLESRLTPISSSVELYDYFRQQSQTSGGKIYVFIDEVQRIDGWHDVVNAMRVDFDCDIYVTGSNAFLLSSEISTYLSGRYVEINVLPLAFSEYLDFCSVKFNGQSDAAMCSDGTIRTFDSIFERYMRFGGMPAIASLDVTQEQHFQYASSLYETVINRDILNRERFASENKISDPDALRRIADFLADNIGNLSSPNSVAETMTKAGISLSDKTVRSYIKALKDAYLFYECRRYDMRGKSLLKTNPKLYLSNLGMRQWLLGGKFLDTGRIFENAVYLQLLFEGYSVQIGKLYKKEIDFIAMHDERRVYIQVADNVSEEKTLDRELSSLRAIKDSNRKMLVVRQGVESQSIDGIDVINARGFFLDQFSLR